MELWVTLLGYFIALIAGVVSFFMGLFKNRNDFLQTMQKSISPLLDSIEKLTERNNELVGKLIAEQEEKLHLIEEKHEWAKERGNLIAKISKLEKQLKKIETLLKSKTYDNQTL